MKTIQRIQAWFKNQCDGEWEHDNAIKIQTLDNPGWLVTIDLTDTSLEGASHSFKVDHSAFDWLFIKVENKVFQGSGDPSKLKAILNYFLEEILTKQNDLSCEYELLIPLDKTPTTLWTSAKGRMIDDHTFEIISIQAPTLQTIHFKTLEEIDLKLKELDQYPVNYAIGEQVQTELIETFQGTRLEAVKLGEIT